MAFGSVSPLRPISVPSATGLALVIFGLLVHAVFIRHHLNHNRVSSSRPLSLSSSSSWRTTMAAAVARRTTGVDYYGTSDYIPPPLFIYRRTKKTGSSSMLAVLLPQLQRMGYTPLYLHRGAMEVAVRSEFVRAHPRRLFIAEHNRITRMHHPRRLAIIADTIRDGYQQMTSFCRYVRKVKSCDNRNAVGAMARCLRSSDAQAQMFYRWAERKQEDDDTYIDLPLSAAHPALSTSVIRTVFPNITLDLTKQYNRRYSACPERKTIRAVYDELYQPLEDQILALKRRMLLLAGYPFSVVKQFKLNITIDDMMDEADALEMRKYPQLLSESSGASRSKKKKSGYSDVHEQLRGSKQHWFHDDQGILNLRSTHKKP